MRVFIYRDAHFQYAAALCRTADEEKTVREDHGISPADYTLSHIVSVETDEAAKTALARLDAWFDQRMASSLFNQLYLAGFNAGLRYGTKLLPADY